MKKLSVLLALTVMFIASAFAQAPRRVLVEEMVSSTCFPSAAADPSLEQFEREYLDNICVLKWHVNWPVPGNDPFYLSYPDGRARARDYYEYPGVPYVHVNGLARFDPRSSIDPLKAAVDNASSLESPYTIDMDQSIEADEIIINVTVSCNSTPPVASDLRLAVVIAERFALYTGTNEKPFHTNAVRTVIPGLTTSGAVMTTTEYPAFTQAEGETKTYRYSAKIGKDWDRNQLIAVAFIQSAGTKEVFQSNWTVPPVVVEFNVPDMFTSESMAEVKMTNVSSAPIRVRVGSANGKLYGNPVTLDPGKQETIQVRVSAHEAATGALLVSSEDGRSIGGHIISWATASVKTGNVATTNAVSSYPNPVTKSVTFSYSINEAALVTLAIYDAMGREVALVVDKESHSIGTYEARIDVSMLAGGSYTYIFSAGAQRITGTMIVQK